MSFITSSSTSRIPVLMYHEIADKSEIRSPLAVTPAAFADQLSYLHDLGWKVISAAALSAILTDGDAILPEKTVVLSFDDGYENFYSQAMPQLSKHGFTATLFMTSGWVKEARPHGPGIPQMLSWGQLSDLASGGIEIGAHTITHPELDQLTGKRLHNELFDSKRQLEDRLGMEVLGLAYPFGYSSSAVRQIAHKVGYTYGYAVSNRTVTPEVDQFAVPRLTVKGATSLEEFSRLIGGVNTFTLRKDRLLTGGWAAVRGARRALREIRGGTPAPSPDGSADRSDDYVGG
jgi:peptidoglycan/xylan/chitin deacetylase (PgdA/CDA1 family)